MKNKQNVLKFYMKQKMHFLRFVRYTLISLCRRERFFLIFHLALKSLENCSNHVAKRQILKRDFFSQIMINDKAILNMYIPSIKLTNDHSPVTMSMLFLFGSFGRVACIIYESIFH